MALEKSFTTETGNTANYWLITNYPADKLVRQGNITLLGYKSEQIRQENEQSGWCARKQIFLDETAWENIYQDVVQSGANLYEELYKYVKNNPTNGQQPDDTPFFGDATNHFDDPSA